MGITVLLAIVGFAVLMTFIGIGVLLGKRTPLKGSCSSVDGGEQGACDACTCHATSGRRGGEAPAKEGAAGRER